MRPLEFAFTPPGIITNFQTLKKKYSYIYCIAFETEHFYVIYEIFNDTIDSENKE